MSLMRSPVSWFKSAVGWSTSRQSWLERASLAGIVLAGILAVLFGSRLPAFQQVLLWGVIVGVALFLLRGGWLQLFGPVLVYDMIRAARRSRYFFLRGLYALFLLFILVSVYLSVSIMGGDEIRRATRLAEGYFETFIVVQLILVVILTPAYVAGSISEEKDRKTLEFILATDLRNNEIVLSKFGARLANLSLLLLTGLPILGLLQFLGGVDPNLVVSGFFATGLTMCGIAGVSILNSVYFKKPRDAIGVTYLMVLAYHILGTTLYSFLQDPTLVGELSFPIWFGGAPTMYDALTWVNAGNPIVAVFEVTRVVAIGMMGGTRVGIDTVLPGILGRYAIFHGVLTAFCLLVAIVRLRRVALRQAYGVARKTRARHRGRAPVGDLPMLWKEVSVERGTRFNWVAAIILAMLFLFSMSFGVGGIIYHYFVDFAVGFDQSRWFSREMNAWVRVAGASVAYLTMLGVAVRASTTIGNERDRQTLDSLLTTPLSSGAILGGKFLGAILSMRLAWVWLGLIWGLGVLTGGLHIFAVPLLVGAWYVYASFFSMVGLWFSMVAKTTMRATVYTMLVSIGLTFGHWLVWMCCMPLFVFSQGGGEGLKYIAEFQFGMTPPFVIGMLSFHGETFSREFGIQDEMVEMVSFCIVGLFIWGVAAVLLWSVALVPRFHKFCGRGEYRHPEGAPLHDDRPRRVRPRREPRPPPLPGGDDWDDDLRERVRGD